MELLVKDRSVSTNRREMQPTSHQPARGDLILKATVQWVWAPAVILKGRDSTRRNSDNQGLPFGEAVSGSLGSVPAPGNVTLALSLLGALESPEAGWW